MSKLALFLVSFLVLSCGQADHSGEEIEPSQEVQQIEVGLKFVNDYVVNCNKRSNLQAVSGWIKSNSLVSESFKESFSAIINKSGSELDFDPIFDAQDYPEEGFELESMDQSNGYLVVRGKKWHEFLLKMKIIKMEERYFVDGCGAVNIPIVERIKR